MNEKTSKSHYTDAQARAAKKYRQSMGEFKVVLPKETKAKFAAAAAAADLSLNQYAITAIEEKIERESC